MRARFFLGFFTLVLCSGCGTVLTHTYARKDGIVGPYSGVRFDAEETRAALLEAFYWPIPFCVIDMPVSAALDTIFLPYDVFQHQPGTNQPPNNALQPTATAH